MHLASRLLGRHKNTTRCRFGPSVLGVECFGGSRPCFGVWSSGFELLLVCFRCCLHGDRVGPLTRGPSLPHVCFDTIRVLHTTTGEHPSWWPLHPLAPVGMGAEEGPDEQAGGALLRVPDSSGGGVLGGACQPVCRDKRVGAGPAHAQGPPGCVYWPVTFWVPDRGWGCCWVLACSGHPGQCLTCRPRLLPSWPCPAPISAWPPMCEFQDKTPVSCGKNAACTPLTQPSPLSALLSTPALTFSHPPFLFRLISQPKY